MCDACVMCRVALCGLWCLYCCAVVSSVCLLCRLWVHALAVFNIYIYVDYSICNHGARSPPEGATDTRNKDSVVLITIIHRQRHHKTQHERSLDGLLKPAKKPRGAVEGCRV